jgi:DNA-binding GntR family transcriptional regulator
MVKLRAVDEDASEATERPGSLTGSVYQQLRADLLEGRYKPGEKLRAEVLRKRFDIGSSPIREALNRLLAEGFVSLEDQKGFRVAEVSDQELRELVETRCLIDGAAIQASVAHYDTAWEERLVLALHRLSRVTRDTSGHDNREWERLHRAFHVALVSGCHSRWLCRISEQLFDNAERYRLLVSAVTSERNELEEHQAITEACLDRRADDAVRLLEEHYGRTYRMVAGSFEPTTVSASAGGARRAAGA